MYKLFLTLFAILALALTGACGGDDDDGGAEATTAAAAATGGASATASDAPEAAVTEVEFTSETFVPTVTLTGPDTWNGIFDTPNEYLIDIPRTVSTPDGGIIFLLPDQVYDKDDATKKVDRPADWVEYFTTHPVISAQSQEATALGGLSGTKISLVAHSTAGIPFIDLPDGESHFRFNEEFEAYVLDAGDEQLLVLVEPGNPAQSEVFFEMVQPALDSVEFAE